MFEYSEQVEQKREIILLEKNFSLLPTFHAVDFGARLIHVILEEQGKIKILKSERLCSCCYEFDSWHFCFFYVCVRKSVLLLSAFSLDYLSSHYLRSLNIVQSGGNGRPDGDDDNEWLCCLTSYSDLRYPWILAESRINSAYDSVRIRNTTNLINLSPICCSVSANWSMIHRGHCPQVDDGSSVETLEILHILHNFALYYGRPTDHKKEY